MTLPASGPISFNAINLELGLSGTANKSINDSNYRTLAGVASGTIDLQDFYGKSAVVISIVDVLVIDTDFHPAYVDSVYELNSNGKIYENGTDVGSWCTPNGSASGYEVKADIVYGTLTGGVTGTWQALSTTRSWIMQRDGSFEAIGISGAQITVQIRDIATATVRDTATITIEAHLI